MNPLLVTLRGPNEIDLDALSNFEAGILFLSLLERLHPGVTFGDLPSLSSSERMGRSWWRRVGGSIATTARGTTDYAGDVFGAAGRGLKEASGEIAEGVGDILRDTFSVAGDEAGSAVRLLTEQKVADGIARYGAAYATKGGSEGMRNLFGGSAAGESVLGFISQLGASFKGSPSNVAPSKPNYLPWVIGGGAVLLVLIAARKR